MSVSLLIKLQGFRPPNFLKQLFYRVPTCELSSFIVLLNFCHWSYHTGGASMVLLPVWLQQRAILHCYVSVSPPLQKRQMQNKFLLVPTLHWAPADKKQQLDHLTFYSFNWLNMILSGWKMVHKITRKIILYTLREKRKGKEIGQKIKSCLCSFHIEYNLTIAY